MDQVVEPSDEELQLWGGIFAEVTRLGLDPTRLLKKVEQLLQKDNHIGTQVIWSLARSGSIEEFCGLLRTLVDRVLRAPSYVLQPCLPELYAVWKEAKLTLLPTPNRPDNPEIIRYLGELQELMTYLHQWHPQREDRPDPIDKIEVDILEQIKVLAKTDRELTLVGDGYTVWAAPVESQEQVLRFLLSFSAGGALAFHGRRDLVTEKAVEATLLLGERYDEGVLRKIRETGTYSLREVLDRVLLKRYGRSAIVDLWIEQHPLPISAAD